MDDIEERFSSALHGTARAWRLTVDRRLKNLGVSQASWMTITLAARACSPLSQSELADQLAVEGATMVAMIDRLVKAGLVIRQPSTTDRRIKRVVVTAAGYRLHDRVKAEAAAMRKEFLAKIDPESIEAATLVLETLQRMLGDS
ncbi:MAG: MarR family transcriptional regulator [Pseudomonadota bacterium]|nr:MarR family transcriptional regulator [Pseudomonadota bacterium]